MLPRWETMQPDPNQYDDPDDDLEEQTDEGDDAHEADEASFQLSAEEEAELSQINDLHIRNHLRGIRQSIERKKKASAAQSSPKATERHNMEDDEKQEPLPLVTEEELAAIADPAERARQRAWYTKFYKDYPNGLERAKEKSAALIAERKRLLHLRIIPQETRPTVNVIANSALFAAVQGKDRQLLHKPIGHPRRRRNHFQRRAIQSGRP